MSISLWVKKLIGVILRHKDVLANSWLVLGIIINYNRKDMHMC